MATITLLILFVFSVPSRAPLNIAFTKVESTEITVHWDPLSLQYVNGRLLGYRVYFQVFTYYYSPLKKNSVTVNATEITLTGLNPGQRYDVSVSAFTSKGEGPLSFRYYVTTGMSKNNYRFCKHVLIKELFYSKWGTIC